MQQADQKHNLSSEFNAKAVCRRTSPATFPCIRNLGLYQIDFGSFNALSWAFDMIWSFLNLKTLHISATYNDDVPTPLLLTNEVDSYTSKNLQLEWVVFFGLRAQFLSSEGKNQQKTFPFLDLFFLNDITTTRQKAMLPTPPKKGSFSSPQKYWGLDVFRDTFVGDAMRRGISGEQKKHVTTGGMLVRPAKTVFMDEISRGLDSSHYVSDCEVHAASCSPYRINNLHVPTRTNAVEKRSRYETRIGRSMSLSDVV
ncbi:pleiotropic drug resistance protein PDR/CDR [Artemisia annua]|uniref:Pleiotropic drug resistance protein PDR/CDR n=1 Tax=Artemisia annua TaxID=35608 RepID=A0A2U1KT84_ARTAN|nr:pleiotropic drug resistance protein PDR/CDR [Artemisia annua]